MKAEIKKDGEVTIVNLQGHLDFETAEPFRRVCMERLIHDKVIFNMKELSFVGSSGITIFIETLRSFVSQTKVKPKFCGLGSEFRRIFAAGELAQLEIYESAAGATQAFITGQAIGALLVPQPELPEFEDETEIAESAENDPA